VIPIRSWVLVLGRYWFAIGLSVLIALLAVLGGLAAEALWKPLAGSTFFLVERILGLFYANVTSQSDTLVIGTDRFLVEIAPSCSGYEGIGLVLVFLSVFLWSFRQDLRFPAAFLLLPAAVVTIWIANVLRIAALVVIGSSMSPRIATGGFHSQAGWLAFNAVALALVAVAWRVPWFRKESHTSSATTTVVNPTAPYLAPFLSLIAAAMVTGAFSDGFDRLYGLRVLAAGAALGCFIGFYRREAILTWTFSWTPIAIGVLVFTIWMAAEPFLGAAADTQTIMEASLTSMSAVALFAWIVFRTIGSVFIVPLVEELAFRGYLARRLVNVDFERVPLAQFSWYGMLTSSVIFGLMHGRWLAGTVSGVLFAMAMYRRGQVMDAVIAHATANSLITAYVLATGNWAVWS
jgi:exosortase E/protease (VPEID-CTERM system)